MAERMFEANVKEFDHTPKDLFVQMNELEGEEWVEQARWIKYEEDLEKETERWGRPHIATLSFHSLINLKTCLESGIMLLDLEACDFAGVAFKVVEELRKEGTLDEDQQAKVMKVLLYKHKCVSERSFIFSGTKKNKLNRASFTIDKSALEDGTRHYRSGSVVDLGRYAPRRDSIIHCLKQGTEGTITLVGSLEGLSSPVVAFVRLSEWIIMLNALEVLLPVRFIFILLTPLPSPNIDCHEVGRSFSTLMSNPTFQATCYKVEERQEILTAINDILDESVVLPPGDFESKNLLSINEIQKLRKLRKRKHLDKAEVKSPEEKRKKEKKVVEKREIDLKYGNPLERTHVPFGGVINDIRRRYSQYWSDIRDGCNVQCFSAIFFIYFACLSPAIAFGGLYGDETENLIGIPATLMATCVSSVVYAIFSANPLVIVGCTGPNLVFDEALFNFAKSHNVEYLPLRVWTAFWVVFFAVLVAGFEGSTLVKYFTKFTTDIFASLVALIFLFEALKKLYEVFKHHPVKAVEVDCSTTVEKTIDDFNNTFYEETHVHLIANDVFGNSSKMSNNPMSMKVQPNAALFSFILMFGTFIIAYFLKIFRNGQFLGRRIRHVLGDFGVPISIAIIVTIDYLMEDTVTQKLKVPSGLQVTAPEKRGWFIPPMGIHENIPAWVPFAAIVPALLLYTILFLNTLICELLIFERTTKKGGGLHWDIVLICFINVFAAVLGAPYMCAATVRAVTHVSALSVMSKTRAPGESAKVVDVIDQRVSGFSVGILMGLSVLLAPILKLIPYPVLYGVFFYMGVSTILGGIQFFDRILLLFKPVKHHPQVSYVRRVKTWKMHMFTGFQFFGLATLWTVKSIKQISLFFPFFIVAIIPLRLSLQFIYTKKELDALDGKRAGQTIKDDDEDLWEEE